MWLPSRSSAADIPGQVAGARSNIRRTVAVIWPALHVLRHELLVARRDEDCLGTGRSWLGAIIVLLPFRRSQGDQVP